MISEGALSQLINSHIHEGETVPTHHLAHNESFENTNLAFWTRKQNEY